MVSEDADSKAGVTNTTETVTVKVTVADNGDGSLKVEKAADGAVELNAVNFTNTYTATGTATLKAKKALGDGNTWPTGKKAVFTLTAVTDGAPMPAAEGQTVEFAEVGEKEFGTITYTLEDLGKTYVYQIAETGTFGGNWTASDPIQAKVTVGPDQGDGSIETTVTYTPDNFTITNTEKKEEENGSVKVTKFTLKNDGTYKDVNQTFYTALFSDGMLTSRVTDVKALVLENAYTTSVTFGNLKYGTYYVAETDANGNPITSAPGITKVEIQNGIATLSAENKTAEAQILNTISEGGVLGEHREKETEQTEKAVAGESRKKEEKKEETEETKTAAVKTGDETPIIPMLAMMLTAGLAALYLSMRRRREKM